MIKYPNGKSYLSFTVEDKKKTSIKKNFSAANRGMNLENEINISNEYYKNQGIALIYKRPTPINVVKVDYTKGARITNAYFEKQSTTDYNGVYKGKYIDFEAKSTQNTTSFPLKNISIHQIEHLEQVLCHGGIAFFIVQFQNLNKIFLIDARFVIDFFKHGKRKSIPLQTFLDKAYLLEEKYMPRIDYIKAINELYF